MQAAHDAITARSSMKRGTLLEVLAHTLDRRTAEILFEAARDDGADPLLVRDEDAFLVLRHAPRPGTEPAAAPQPPGEPRRRLMLTTAEACEVLGISYQALLAQREKGRIKGVRIGDKRKSRWRWNAKSIEDYAEARNGQTT